MAFFKFRKAGDDTAAAAPAESIEVMRRRARHRLIGAAVLVLIGVVGFPLLFETQPRPVQVDIPIDIPDRAKAKPLPASPAAPVVAAPAVSGPVTAPAAIPAAPATPAPPPKVTQAEGLDAREEIVAAKPAPKPAVAASAPTKPAVKPETKPEPKPAVTAKADDGARAKALLEGKATPAAAPAAAAAPSASAANGDRYVVQVGAFADADKARETRLKVERAGLKTYTHVAETKEGRRIRVRVGPFANRAEADRAAEKIKGLDLPAAILTL